YRTYLHTEFRLRSGTNTLTLEIRNTGGPGGLLLTADPAIDSDNDGVPDAEDRCWLSPSGLPVNAEGCSYFLTEELATLCAGDTLSWRGRRIAQPGRYTDSLVSSLGCDSLLRLDVTVYPVAETFIDTLLCQGETVPVGGQVYDQTGFYVDTLVSALGCDSIVYLDLEMLPFFDVTIDTAVVVCEQAQVAGVRILEDTLVVERLIARTGCDSTVRYQVTAIDKPATNFDQIGPFCVGEEVVLEAEVLPGVSYLWSGGSNQPSLPVSEGGWVFLITVAQFCVWEDSVEVPSPIALPIELAYSPQVCAGAETGFLRFSPPTAGIAPWTWTVNGLRYDSPPDLSGLPAGPYTISLTDGIGCEADTVIQIESLPPLEVTLPREVELELGESTTLTIETNRDPAAIAQVRWTPDSFVSCRDCLDPDLIQPLRSQGYMVTVRDSLGCAATASLDLHVRVVERVFLPTAFSPNGDGINDLYHILLGPEVGSVQGFEVYSRWGRLAYAAEGPGPIPQLSWDGLGRRGQPVPEGVYVCVLRYRLLDGQARVQRRTITVLR
ncbi:MAG: gliding motility-associated C-terminal domain-containing protein, partial [Bacteroidetes bacterium]